MVKVRHYESGRVQERCGRSSPPASGHSQGTEKVQAGKCCLAGPVGAGSEQTGNSTELDGP